MIEILNLLTQPNGLALVGIFGGVLVVLTFILSIYRYNVRDLQLNTQLKREMIEKGIPPQDIAQIVATSNRGRDPDAGLARLSTALAICPFAGESIEEIISTYTRLDPARREVFDEAIHENETTNLREQSLLALIRGLKNTPTAPSPAETSTGKPTVSSLPLDNLNAEPYTVDIERR